MEYEKENIFEHSACYALPFIQCRSVKVYSLGKGSLSCKQRNDRFYILISLSRRDGKAQQTLLCPI